MIFERLVAAASDLKKKMYDGQLSLQAVRQIWNIFDLWFKGSNSTDLQLTL